MSGASRMRDSGSDPTVVASTDRWAVIDKPPGLRSVPGLGPTGNSHAEGWVRRAFPLADGPLTVHRLDMATSGLLLYGLDRASQASLSVQFMKRRVGKAYTALVARRPARDEGEISLPLRVDWPNRPRQIVDHELGKPAVTRWRVVEAEGERTRLEMIPVTGRTHQLRVHAAHTDGLGCPILGDELYGDAESAPRLLLHAAMLEFDDPETGARVRLESPAPF